MSDIADVFVRGIPTPRVQPGHESAKFRAFPELPPHLKRVVDRTSATDVHFLNARDTEDLWTMIHRLPTLSFAIQESQKRLFGTPFEITLGGFVKGTAPWKRGGAATAGSTSVPLTELTEEFREQVIERFWMPWLVEMDTRRRAFGVAPYFFEAVPIKLEQAMRRRSRTPRGEGRTLVHFVPRTPPIGSGRVGTRLDKGAHQVLVWEWERDIDHPYAGQVDPNMLWLIEKMPTLTGQYCSQLAPLLHDWRYITRMRAFDMQTAYLNANPQGVITYKPDAGRGGGSGGGASGAAGGTAYLEGAGRAATYPGTGWEGGGGGGGSSVQHLQDVEDFRHAQVGGERQMMTGDGLVGTDLYTASAVEIDPEGENRLELEALLRNNPSVRAQLRVHQGRRPPNPYELRPYEEYHPLPPPRPGAPTLLQHLARLDRYAAVVAGYPLDQVAGASAGSAAGGGPAGTGLGGSGGGGSGSGALASTESTNRFVIAHLRSLAKFYTKFVRGAYLSAYSESFRRARKTLKAGARRTYRRRPQPHELMELDEMLHVEVVFPCVPLVSTQDMAYFYSLRMIDEQDFFRFSMNTLGLDDQEKPPAAFRTAVQAHFPAVPLEMQQLELQREAQEAQIKLQQQQHTLAEKQHREQVRATAAAAQADSTASKRPRAEAASEDARPAERTSSKKERDERGEEERPAKRRKKAAPSPSAGQE